MAVDLAKLSLWLATLAKDHPFTFLDHALRCGDSLVGLTREQIADFHWKDAPQLARTARTVIAERVQAATRYRQEILEARRRGRPVAEERRSWPWPTRASAWSASPAISSSRPSSPAKDKKRRAKRESCSALLTGYLPGRHRPCGRRRRSRSCAPATKGITPFHWEIEFPEVFGRENPGFDCDRRQPAVPGREANLSTTLRRCIPRLACDDFTPRHDRQRRSSGPLLSSRDSICCAMAAPSG